MKNNKYFLLYLILSCNTQESFCPEKGKKLYKEICVYSTSSFPVVATESEIEVVLSISEDIVKELNFGHKINKIEDYYPHLKIEFVDYINADVDIEAFYLNLYIQIRNDICIAALLHSLAHEMLHYYNDVSGIEAIHEYHKDFMSNYLAIMKSIGGEKYVSCM